MTKVLALNFAKRIRYSQSRKPRTTIRLSPPSPLEPLLQFSPIHSFISESLVSCRRIYHNVTMSLSASAIVLYGLSMTLGTDDATMMSYQTLTTTTNVSAKAHSCPTTIEIGPSYLESKEKSSWLEWRVTFRNGILTPISAWK